MSHTALQNIRNTNGTCRKKKKGKKRKKRRRKKKEERRKEKRNTKHDRMSKLVGVQKAQSNVKHSADTSHGPHFLKITLDKSPQ